MVDGQIWGGSGRGGSGEFSLAGTNHPLFPPPPPPPHSQNHILIFNQGKYDKKDENPKFFDNRLNCSCSWEFKCGAIIFMLSALGQRFIGTDNLCPHIVSNIKIDIGRTVHNCSSKIRILFLVVNVSIIILLLFTVGNVYPENSSQEMRFGLLYMIPKGISQTLSQIPNIHF